METKTKSFDAVAESRKWKEAVGRETAGMNREQELAYFDREKTLERMRQTRRCVAATQPASS